MLTVVTQDRKICNGRANDFSESCLLIVLLLWKRHRKKTIQFCPKVLDPHFDKFPGFSGFSGLFDEVSLETKVRRYFGEFSGRLLS